MAENTGKFHKMAKLKGDWQWAMGGMGALPEYAHGQRVQLPSDIMLRKRGV